MRKIQEEARELHEGEKFEVKEKLIINRKQANDIHKIEAKYEEKL